MRAFDAVGTPLDGSKLVEASAGTGKTYTLSTIVLRLIAERGIPLPRILVVTFTEAATLELRTRIGERIRWLIGELEEGRPGDPLVEALLPTRARALERLVAALRFIDESSIHTIHGFCHRMLVEHAYESGLSLDSALITDDGELLRDAARAYFGTRVLPMEPEFLAYLERCGLGPSQIENLARQIAGHPDAQIVGGVEEVPLPVSDEAGAYVAVRQVWKSEQRAIEQLLVDALPGLNARSYKSAKIDAWMQELERVFESEAAPRGILPVGAERLGAAALTKGTKKAFQPPNHRFFDLLDDWVERRTSAEHRFASMWRSVLHDAAREMSARVAGEKRRQGLMSFDDLLRLTHGAVCGSSHHGEVVAQIAGRFDAVLIDEFQDTDGRQYEIFHRLFNDGRRPFFMVGDPKQSIYRFRGADIHAYLRASREAGDSVYTLGTNWRSDGGLVAAVNGIFGQRPAPFIDESIVFAPVDAAAEYGAPLAVGDEARAPFEFLCAEDALGKDDAAFLAASDIQRLLTDGTRAGAAVEPCDVAVLTRTNAEAELMASTLHRRGIPAVVTSSRSVFTTDEARDLHTILCAVAQPHRRGLLRAALGTALLGCDATYIGTLADDQERYERITLLLRQWHAKWRDHGVWTLLGAVFSATLPGHARSGLLRLLALPDGSRRYGAYRQMAHVLHARQREKRAGAHDLCRWLGMKIRAGDTDVEESEQLMSPADEDAVRVMTIHKSKGLEFPVVYCPFLGFTSMRRKRADFVFYHEVGEDGGPRIDCGGDDMEEHRELAASEERAEDRRMLYVALTRAKHHCVTLLGPTNSLHLTALAALLFDSTEELKKAGGALLRSRAIQLAKASDGAIGVRDALPDTEQLPFGSQRDSSLQVRPVIREVEQTTYWSSFSSFVHDGEARPWSAVRVLPGETRLVGDGTAGAVALFGPFERGAVAGSCLHRIYELVAFDGAEIDGVVGQCLGEFGFDPDEWGSIVAAGIRQTLEMDFATAPHSCRLADVGPRRSLRELPFLIKMGDDSQAGHLTPGALTDLVKGFAPGGIDAEYAASLAQLGMGRTRGFWRGYIDLVFEKDGRFYLADYKSNVLGPTIAHYGEGDIRGEMARHHYYLQGLFYSLALHRHLTATLPDYDYDRHFGGAFFLFVRGMAVMDGQRYGVFEGRLEKAAMDDFVARTGGD